MTDEQESTWRARRAASLAGIVTDEQLLDFSIVMADHYTGPSTKENALGALTSEPVLDIIDEATRRNGAAWREMMREFLEDEPVMHLSVTRACLLQENRNFNRLADQINKVNSTKIEPPFSVSKPYRDGLLFGLRQAIEISRAEIKRLEAILGE